MAREKAPEPNRRERLSRFGRNFNIAVGALALVGSALVPPLAVPLEAYAALNGAQAAGFEAARRHYAKKRTKNKQKK